MEKVISNNIFKVNKLQLKFCFILLKIFFEFSKNNKYEKDIINHYFTFIIENFDLAHKLSKSIFNNDFYLYSNIIKIFLNSSFVNNENKNILNNFNIKDEQKINLTNMNIQTRNSYSYNNNMHQMMNNFNYYNNNSFNNSNNSYNLNYTFYNTYGLKYNSYINNNYDVNYNSNTSNYNPSPYLTVNYDRKHIYTPEVDKIRVKEKLNNNYYSFCYQNYTDDDIFMKGVNEFCEGEKYKKEIPQFNNIKSFNGY
jgi:hypothetical protein